MKTDVIRVSSEGDQIDEALVQVEKVAAYKGLSHKNSLHLRLLAEEMLCLMRAITYQTEGLFWINDEDDVYELHLKVATNVDFEQREKLLEVASSGKNEAAKGFMGKIRSFFDPIAGLPLPLNLSLYGGTADMSWSMRIYQDQLAMYMQQQETGIDEAWDELEKSVVAHIADDVKVSIEGRIVELIIYKKMA